MSRSTYGPTFSPRGLNLERQQLAHMTGVWDAVLGVAVGLTTAVLGYLLKRRMSSGSVNTSDARMLWAEATNQRKSLEDQLARALARNAELEDDLDAARRGSR